MAEATRNGVVMLNGSNFPTWKIQCKMTLMKMGVWRLVEGNEIAPDETDVRASRLFNERRDRALATIVLAIEPSLLYLLGDPEDPVTVWRKLCDQFQKKSWANRLNLRRKLYGLKLKDNEPIQGHIKAMVEIFEELAVIGEAIDEEDRVVHLLASLPDSYQMLVTALEANADVPQLELVTERLMHEERKIKEKSSAIDVHGNFRDEMNQALFVSKPKQCFYCGKTGHIKRFCDELKKKNESVEEKKQEVANFSSLHYSSDSDSDGECIALFSKAEKKVQKWIIDSAASEHMCNDRRKMHNIRRLRFPKRVSVGNGELVDAKFEGTVKIVVRTGGKIIKLKLTNVLYVPELKYNLLSVPMAATMGKKVEFDESTCSIIDKQTKEVIGTGSKVGKLYYLDAEEDRAKNGISSHRREMEEALLSFNEHNFKEDMMKRLNTIEEDKLKFNARLRAIEENSRNNSYEFKEDNHLNGRKSEFDVMQFLQEDSEEEKEEEDVSEDLESEILDILPIQENNSINVNNSRDKIQEDKSEIRHFGKRFRFARKFCSSIRRKCVGALKSK